MKRNFLLLLSFLTSLVSCKTYYIDGDTSDDSESLNFGGTISSTYEGMHVSTILGDYEIKDGTFQVSVPNNDAVQSFFLCDGNDNVYMMARTAVDRNSELEIGIHSSALAMVMMHPIFSPVKSDGYDAIVEIIASSSRFEAFEEKVAQAVAAGRPLYDETNEELLIAFSDLIEDLFADVDETVYTDSLDIAQVVSMATRAVYEDPKIYPLKADLTGHTLTLRCSGLTPSYYGTVTRPDASVEDFRVVSRGDYGVLDLFTKTVEDFHLGDPAPYTFTQTGSYNFDLSSRNAAALSDLALSLANSFLSILGLDFGQSVVAELSQTMARAVQDVWTGFDDNAWDGLSWVAILTDAGLDFIKNNAADLSIETFAKVLSGSLNFYNRIKGSANTIARLCYAVSAPADINFCLCNYGEEISSCADVSLMIADGDGQSGYAGERLFKPISVYVRAETEDGSQPRYNYYMVKFEIESGNGTLYRELVGVDEFYMAETLWELGEEGEQKVRAVVVDRITEKEISNPVYFTATIEHASVTVRLDWHKLSGNTDIDLHVTDPYGEKIWYSHMTSASGGYLDRDDTIGPGPEHVYWENAPAGTYLVQVHYYGSETQEVTSFTVSVNAEGRTYAPVTMSLSYNQMVTVGSFTVGDRASSSPYIPQIRESGEIIPNPSFPVKN